MQEFTKRVPALQVVDEIPERHSAPPKQGVPFHDFRVGHYGGIARNTFILLLPLAAGRCGRRHGDVYKSICDLPASVPDCFV
jgi:hypothetical protein